MPTNFSSKEVESPYFRNERAKKKCDCAGCSPHDPKNHIKGFVRFIIKEKYNPKKHGIH